jgi:hypothetical protein
MIMTNAQRTLYERIKSRYEAHLKDNVKHGLVMVVLKDSEADILAEIGFGKKWSIMRSEIPGVLKAFESLPTTHEQISLF